MNFPAYPADPSLRGRQNEGMKTMKPMRKISLVMLTVMLAVMLSGAFPGSAVADTDRGMYIKLDGIEGESAFPLVKGCIDVLSFTHGTLDPDPRDPKRGVLESITFSHLVDRTTPAIQEACMKGTIIPSGTLYICRMIGGKETVVYTVTLTEIQITRAEVRVEDKTDGSFQLVEYIQMNVKKMRYEEVPPNTGDSAPLMLWVTLTAVPCVTVCGLLLLKRRGRRS